MRRHALAMGAAVLAAVPVVISPLPASAASSPMTFGDWLEFFAVSSDNALIAPLWTNEPYWAIYYTMLMNVYQMPYINGVPIEPSAYDMRAGYYLRDGVRHRGSVTLWSRRYFQNGGNSGSMPLFVGDDCSISATVEPVSGKPSVEYYVDYSINSASYPALYIASALARRDMRVNVTAPGFAHGTVQHFFTGNYFNYVYLGRITSGEPVEIGDDFDAILGFGGYPSTQLLGQAVTMPKMPTSDVYATITADNALDYIDEVLNPWILEQAPQLEPYLFTETEPAPTYPVQETWSEDADWPEGNLLPTIPAADYSVDIPEVMTEGVSFWWRCLGVLFDGLGITAVVVGLLALGIVLYFVLR